VPKTTLTRQELYDLVWTDAMRTVAAAYGVSDVWLKKVCAKGNIPTPDRGYWAKLAAGKSVIRAKLPARGPGMPDVVSVTKPGHHWRYDPVAELAEPIPDPPVFSEPMDDVTTRVTKLLGKVVRCKDLASPCPVVRRLLEADERRREKKQIYSWSDGPLFDSPFEARRLRLLNAIALALPRVGGGLDSSCKQGRKLTLHVGGQGMELLLDHPGAKPNRWGEWSTRPGPVDVLKLDLPPSFKDQLPLLTWSDTQGAKLEDQLTDIVVAIGVAGEAHYRQSEINNYAWLLKRRADNEAEVIKRRIEAERLAEERRLKAAKERRERLFAQAKAWRTATDIRGFVEDVLSSDARHTDLQPWAAWARSEADALDPALNGALIAADISSPGGDDFRDANSPNQGD
jgi:hypothetical protein